MPDVPNIHKILIIIGHRFGYQLVLEKSSGRNLATTAWICVVRLFAFPQDIKTLIIDEYLLKLSFPKEACS